MCALFNTKKIVIEGKMHLQQSPATGAAQTPWAQPPNPRAVSTSTGAGPGNSPEPAGSSSRWVLRGLEENSQLEEHLEAPGNTHQMLQGQLKRGRARGGDGKLQIGGVGGGLPSSYLQWLVASNLVFIQTKARY